LQHVAVYANKKTTPLVRDGSVEMCLVSFIP
jgi:hypothetical protein